MEGREILACNLRELREEINSHNGSRRNLTVTAREKASSNLSLADLTGMEKMLF